MRQLLKIVVVAAAMMVVLTPVACASPGESTLMIPDDGDLTISWRTRTFADDLRLRLYVINPSGSKEFLTEEHAYRGVGTYHFVDRRNRGGQRIQYRLVVVTPDGRESILAVATCSEPHVAADGVISKTVSRVQVGVCVGTADPQMDPGRSLRQAQWGLEKGTRPRPPVPVPRRAKSGPTIAS